MWPFKYNSLVCLFKRKKERSNLDFFHSAIPESEAIMVKDHALMESSYSWQTDRIAIRN